MGRRGWLALILLGPIGLVAVGLQIALAVGLLGAGQMALGGWQRSPDRVSDGAGTIRSAAHLLDAAMSSPPARLLAASPLTLGAMDDLRVAARAVATASDSLPPASRIGMAAVGFGGSVPVVSGTTVNPERLASIEPDVAEVDAALRATRTAVAEVPGSGPLGRPIAAVTESLLGSLDDVIHASGAAVVAMPHLPAALGAQRPHRYLLCALNDAEIFASGGAPLSAFLVEVDRGTVSVPISGQMESKLSPDNPPITWPHVGGEPWYRPDRRYPFVNSNFHPDFRTAGQDMQRAWAALGYPPVDGVLTVDVGALVAILRWIGPADTQAYGVVTSDTLVRTLLVDSYRQFNSEQGVLERHARNAALTQALGDHMTSPGNLLGTLRGILDAIPTRHLQAWFPHAGMQAAVEAIGAEGALTDAPGDLLAAHSQSGPSKLSVFQERQITQEVQLTPGGGAQVTRTVRFANAVPPGLEGDPTTYRGYLALRARLRVAHRIPLEATDVSVSTGPTPALIQRRTGPWPDDRGGQVVWQGHDTEPGGTTTVQVRYSLPDGTFQPGTYRVHADPQAMTRQVPLTIRVLPSAGTQLPDSDGWVRAGSALQWTGTLERPMSLAVG